MTSNNKNESRIISRCTECDRGFPSQRELDAHMKKHTEQPKEKKFQCPICQKFFTSKDYLEVHIRKHETRTDGIEDEQHLKFIAENFDMKCERCDTIFRSLYEARAHYKDAHNDGGGFIKCCNVKLKRVSMIKGHIESHLNPVAMK